MIEKNQEVVIVVATGVSTIQHARKCYLKTFLLLIISPLTKLLTKGKNEINGKCSLLLCNGKFHICHSLCPHTAHVFGALRRFLSDAGKELSEVMPEFWSSEQVLKLSRTLTWQVTFNIEKALYLDIFSLFQGGAMLFQSKV